MALIKKNWIRWENEAALLAARSGLSSVAAEGRRVKKFVPDDEGKAPPNHRSGKPLWPERARAKNRKRCLEKSRA
jgi:hypothetical protein